MCHRRVIMKSEKEFINELKNGENLPPESSENYVADVPNNFKKWHKDNEGRFANWKRLPNFLEDNKKYQPNLREVKSKVDNILKSRQKEVYVAFEPFSPIVREEFAKLKDKRLKDKLFNEILDDKDFKLIGLNEKTKRKTILHPLSREPDSKNWIKTQAMARALNEADKDVIFLPEYKDKPSADALLKFKNKYTIADFKYFRTLKSGTIATELINTFDKIETVVIKFKQIDLGIIVEAIDEVKRKNKSLGNIVFINKYNKVYEIDKKELISDKYIYKLRGKL